MQNSRRTIKRNVDGRQQVIIVYQFPKWLGWLLAIIFIMQINLVMFNGSIIKTAADAYIFITGKNKAKTTADLYYHEYQDKIAKEFGYSDNYKVSRLNMPWKEVKLVKELYILIKRTIVGFNMIVVEDNKTDSGTIHSLRNIEEVLNELNSLKKDGKLHIVCINQEVADRLLSIGATKRGVVSYEVV